MTKTKGEVVQERRGKHLRSLMDTYHRDKMGDYKETYQDFETTYFGTPEESICNVCGEERRALVHTDSELHPVDAADGLVLHKFEPITESIPKYAAVREDETYGMIEVFDNLADAIRAESGSIGEEYLMNPAGVYDLDTNKQIETVQVGMSKEAFLTLCGLVQSYDELNAAGIFSGSWEELRKIFPIKEFLRLVPLYHAGQPSDRTLYYDPDAGE